jgi:hypothetical protein
VFLCGCYLLLFSRISQHSRRIKTNRFPIAIGKIDGISRIIKSVHFATLMLEQKLHFIRVVIISGLGV